MNRLDWSALVFNGHLLLSTCDLHPFSTIIGALSDLRSDIDSWIELELDAPGHLQVVYQEMSDYLKLRAEAEEAQISEPVVNPEEEIKG